ncbi:MAG: hypothetical protein MPL62_03155 [Alphaproteobacteria bacterium]|nr:hypothetical protein [Alphaproteobacteria bacterium]
MSTCLAGRNWGSSMAGMPSLGGPPEMISESETLSLLKLVFCQSRLMMGWSGESMVGSPKS